jgi:hypothetical protein
MLKSKVIELRSKGKSYLEINRLLNSSIPKSTLSYWCKNVGLPIDYKDKIKKINKNNLLKGRNIANQNRVEKVRDHLNNTKLIFDKYFDKSFLDNDLKAILAILYLSEGAKWKSHRGLLLGNTDKRIIILYIYLLRVCYGIDRNKLKFHINYRADQDLSKLIRYWSKLLKVKKDQFYQTKPDLRTVGKKTRNNNYQGVCVVVCPGTIIQLELDKIIDVWLDKITTNSLRSISTGL